MFLGGMAEMNKDVIDIQGISAPIFSFILDFIYTGK